MANFAAGGFPDNARDYTQGRDLRQYALVQSVRNVRDVALVIELAGSEDVLKMWMEQVQPRGVRIAAGVSAAVEPKARVYRDARQLVGLLSGLVGAAQYEVLSNQRGQALNHANAQSAAQIVLVLVVILGKHGALGFPRAGGRELTGSRGQANMTLDLIGVWIGGILTLLVFSYLLGDSPLFRFAQAVFVGVTIGYATTVAVHLVLLPRLFIPLANGFPNTWPLFVPLLLGIMLLLKLRTRWAGIGNIPIGYLFGSEAPWRSVGALSGALLPQLGATLMSLSPLQSPGTLINNLLLVIGTIGTLLSFRFLTGGERPLIRLLDSIGRGWGYIGRWFMLIAFGAILQARRRREFLCSSAACITCCMTGCNWSRSEFL